MHHQSRSVIVLCMSNVPATGIIMLSEVHSFEFMVVLQVETPIDIVRLVGELLGDVLAIECISTAFGHDVVGFTTYPVAFSNCSRPVSVIFSLVERIFAGSTLPPPNFFSAPPRAVIVSLDLMQILYSEAHPCQHSPL